MKGIHKHTHRLSVCLFLSLTHTEAWVHAQTLAHIHILKQLSAHWH